VRRNRAGEPELPFYGRLSALALDPIEKKPLYHFHPGSRILSIGFVGCNFHCPFCQNYQISQDVQSAGGFYEPARLIEMARSQGSIGIAYTYSEPVVHLEYVLETAALARKSGLKNVLVSAGYINPEPASELLGLMDAANVDLKGQDPEFYRREIGGDMNEVRRFLEQAAGRIHLEITTLVIPGRNDDPAGIAEMAAFIAGIDPNIPYHLSCYYPVYRYTIPPTPVRTVVDLAKVAGERLPFVYLGNVGARETNTCCPRCGEVAVRRSGYNISVLSLAEGRCTRCGAALPIVGA
jgi:pyruvate formate lyase activating enzyme